MNKIAKVVTICLLGAIATPLAAQNNDNVYNESVVVTGSYKPVIEESEKINVAPQITDTATTLHRNFTYSIAPHRLTSLYYPTRIKAARIIGEPTTRLYNSYLRVGMGNYWSPMAEAYFMSTRHRKLNYGAYVNHHSSWGTLGKKDKETPFTPNYYGKNYYSQTDATLFGRFIVGDHTQIATDLSYSNDYNLYYGFSDSTLHLLTNTSTVNYRDSLDVKDYRAMYNHLVWRGGVKSLYTDAGHFGYEFNAAVGNLWTAYQVSELGVALDLNLHYGFPLSKKDATRKGIIALDADWQGYRVAAKSNTATAPMYYSPATYPCNSRFANVIDLQPSIEFLLKGFKLHAGTRLTFENYDTAQLHFHIYPDVAISKSFMKEALNFSLGASGGYDANSINSIRQENPYIVPWGGDLKGTSHYDFYLRMRVNFNKKLMLKLHGEYSLFRNDLTFAPDTNFALLNVFTPIYFDYSRVKAGGEFSFVNDELLSFAIGGNYYYYHTDTTLYYRPNWDAYATLGLNYKDKWLFKLQGLVMGNVNGLNYSRDTQGILQPTVEKLPLRYGLNFEIEYRHTRALSFFLKFDNLCFQRYNLWVNYPSQRMTFLAGLTYTILTKKQTKH